MAISRKLLFYALLAVVASTLGACEATRDWPSVGYPTSDGGKYGA